MAYGKYGKKRMGGRRGSTAKRPALSVKTRPKRVAVARKSRVDKIARQVRTLQVAKYGAPQVQRQSFRSSVGGGATFTCSTLEPVCFCCEAIAIGNEVYSTQVDGLGNYDVTGIGNWVQQPFALTGLNPANEKFDLQQYRNSKSLGVRSTYLYRGTSYDIQMFGNKVNGYLHCYEITPRKSVVRVTDQERKLPFAIPSFVHMGEGGDDTYDQSSSFFSIKKRFTKYFNTIGPDANAGYVQTNNLAYKRLWHKGRKLITGSDIAGVNLVTDQDIATRKQTWLLFTFTSNAPATADSSMRLQIQRVCHWSDSEGSK